MDAMAPEQVVLQVRALLERRRTAQARVLLKSALAQHPAHTELLVQAAFMEFLDDQNEQALSTVRQVLATEPTHHAARALYFQLLMRQNAYPQAEQVIVDLLREYPEAAEYYAQYGHLMLRTLNLTKARQLATEGLKYDAHNDDCLAVRTIADFIEQRSNETSHNLQQLLLRHPESLQTLLLLVVALEARADYRGALQICQQLVRAHPTNPSLISLAQSLSVQAHWSMLPLWPLQRWGWGASFVFWIGSLVLLGVVRPMNPTLGSILTWIILAFVVYSWVWPSILKRIKQ